MRKAMSRMRERESKLQSSVARQPRFADKTGGIKRIDPTADGSGLPAFEIFVRRADTAKSGLGPWVRLKDIRGDESAREAVMAIEALRNGEREQKGEDENNDEDDDEDEESVLQNWGQHQQQPQQQQQHREDVVEQAQVEARSRLHAWVVSAVFGAGMGGDKILIEEASSTLPKFKKLRARDFQFGYRLIAADESIYIVHANKKAAEAVVACEPQDASCLLSGFHEGLQPPLLDVGSLMSWVQNVEEVAQDVAATSIHICSDGSATMHGVGCLDAKAGVIAVPVRGNQPIFDASCLLEVSGVGPFVSTPFDCEMFAALTALVAAGVLADSVFDCRGLARADVNTGADAGADAGSVDTGLPVSVFTDSRSVLRALRTGPTSALATRSSASRLAVWELCMAHARTGNVTNGTPRILVEWVNGHPERRGDYEQWSAEEVLTFNADAIAAGERKFVGINHRVFHSVTSLAVLSAASRVRALRAGAL